MERRESLCEKMLCLPDFFRKIWFEAARELGGGVGGLLRGLRKSRCLCMRFLHAGCFFSFGLRGEMWGLRRLKT
jgi:hypothetical protein